MSDYLSLDDLKVIAAPTIEDVVVESLGGKKVKVRSLTALELVKFYKAHTERANQGKEQHHAAAFLSLALTNENGTAMFASMDEGMEQLLKLPHVALLEMQVVASRLTPLNLEDVEKRAKN